MWDFDLLEQSSEEVSKENVDDWQWTDDVSRMKGVSTVNY
jgi:hypothetical protein